MSDEDEAIVSSRFEELRVAQLVTTRPASAELRGRARCRRIRRRLAAGTGSAAAITIVLVMTLVLAGPANPPRPRTAASPDLVRHLDGAEELVSSLSTAPVAVSPRAADSAAATEARISLSLLAQLDGRSTGGNVIVSPWTLDQVLTMVELGARGQTQAEIARALGSTGLSPAVQADRLAALRDELAASASADHVALADASSVWLQQGLPLEQPYLTDLERYFDTGVWEVDLEHSPSSSAQAINDWLRSATGSEIRSMVDPGDLSPLSASVLLSASRFSAQWAVPFPKVVTATFYAPAGPEPVPFLSDLGTPASPELVDYRVYLGSDLVAAELPYWNGSSQHPGHFAALLVMPRQGRFDTFAARFDPSGLRRVLAGLKSQPTLLRVPELQLQASNIDVRAALEAMGVHDAFTPAADFGGASPLPTYVTLVKQEANLSLTRWGTVASSASASFSSLVSRPSHYASLLFNRPFLLFIRDIHTGAILYAASVTDPTQP